MRERLEVSMKTVPRVLPSCALVLACWGCQAIGASELDLAELPSAEDASTAMRPDAGTRAGVAAVDASRASPDASRGAPSVDAGPSRDASASSPPIATVGTTAPIAIDPGRELMITDLSVVEDPIRTTWSAPAGTAGRGVWTFGHLMREMAGASPAGEMVLQWLREWEVDQRVGLSVARARPTVRPLLIDPWLERSGCPAGAIHCELDLEQAPFRLLAIVDRIDLRDAEPALDGAGESDRGLTRHAGEGRFVFGAIGPAGERLPFTVIFEYSQLAGDADDVRDWAARWHALGALPFGASYNAALEAITRGFAGRGVAPSRPHGSGIAQVRTNENALSPRWELREFRLTLAGLEQAGVIQTPDLAENGTARLATRITSHAAAIRDGSYRVAEGELGASAPTPSRTTFWNAAAIADSTARHRFSLTTCSGCHAGETATRFVHVATREAGAAAALSGFLVGIDVADPITGEVRRFADLDRRAEDLRELLSLPPDADPGRGRDLTGARVH
jgi:hypothetical protein